MGRLAWSMEVDGFEQRARAMLEMAPQVPVDQPAPIDGFERWFSESLGVVLTLAP